MRRLALMFMIGCTGPVGGSSDGGSGGGGASTNGGGVGGGSAGGGLSSNGGGLAGAGGGASATGGGSTTDGGLRWVPAAGTTFFWDLQSAPPDVTKNVGAIDMDGFNNSATTVAAVHSAGKKAVCYVDVGTYEPGRPDSAQFTAAMKGSDVQGWPGEKWLDVRPSGPSYAALQAIITARLRLCADKGFDAIEPDNLDSYQNGPGFPTSAADQLAYNTWVAHTAHALGLAVFQKNDLDQVAQLVGVFDGALDEECNKYSECATLQPYLNAHKPVWNAEYTDDGQTTASFCSNDVNQGIVGALFSLALDGTVFQPCANDVGVVH